MKDEILQLFYPNRCLFCSTPLPTGRKPSVCSVCMADFRRQAPYPLPLKGPEQGWAAFQYTTAVRNVVHRFKFQGRSYYAPTLAVFLSMTLQKAQGNDAASEYDCVSWVPVSALRRLKRGYDQSRCLAKETAHLLELPLVSTLRKVRHNRPQSSLDGQRRQSNVCGAYRIREAAVYADQRVLLIDDVCTTGATLHEACRTLETAGVFPTALCLARAGHSREEEN